MDYRRRAVEYKDEGRTFKQLREVFKICSRTYYIWKKRLASGYYDKKTKQTRRRKIDKEKLREAVKNKPDAYLWELAEQFDCSAQAVFVALKKLGITLKKNLFLQGKIRS
jgi:transposase